MTADGIGGEYPVLRHANSLESVLTYEARRRSISR